MAASTADAFAGAPLRTRLRGSLRRLGGVAARGPGGRPGRGAAGASTGATPRLNQATAQPVRNPAGPLGAYAADLLYQLFGLAAWLPVLVSPELGRAADAAAGRSPGPGCRSSACRWRCWHWPRFLAALPPLSPDAWPLRAGLGGAVGDLQWRWLEPRLGERGFAAAQPGRGRAASASRRWACAGPRASGPRASSPPARSGSAAGWAMPPAPPR